MEASESSSQFRRMCDSTLTPEVERDVLAKLGSCPSEDAAFALVWPQCRDFAVDPRFRGKDGDEAEKYRSLGNKAFQSGDFTAALTLFNRGVLVAPCCGPEPADGGPLSLVYANRSVVFLQTKHYSASLRDIDRAEESGYPEAGKYKLLGRKGRAFLHVGRLEEAMNCFDRVIAQMKTLLSDNPAAAASKESQALRLTLRETMNAKRDCENRAKRRQAIPGDRAGAVCVEPGDPFASFMPAGWYDLGGANRRYPSLSRSVTVGSRWEGDVDFGRGVRAEEHLKPGTLICKEKPLASVLYVSRFGTHCQNCYRPAPSPVPCRKCSRVAFCSDLCRDAACAKFHDAECAALGALTDPEIGPLGHLAYRALARTTPDEWRRCASAAEGSRLLSAAAVAGDVEPPVHDADDLEHLLTLERHLGKRSPGAVLRAACAAAYLVKCLQVCGRLPPSTSTSAEGDGRAVACMGGTALKLLLAVSCNSVPVTECYVRDGVAGENELGLAVYPTASLFNHSCDPDVHCTFRGDEILVRCVKEVQRHGQVFVAYNGFRSGVHSADERRHWLSRRYHFDCGCRACAGSWPMAVELSSRPEMIRCSGCGKWLRPRFVLDVCPSCDTDMRGIVSGWTDFRRRFDEVRDQVAAGRGSAEAVEFLEAYCHFLSALLMQPSAEFSFVIEILRLAYELAGNVNNVDSQYLVGVKVLEVS